MIQVMSQNLTMEPFLIRFLNTVALAFLGYWMVIPVIKNEIDNYYHRIYKPAYKISSAILIFSFTTNLGDLLFNFGRSYFIGSIIISWVALGYCLFSQYQHTQYELE